MAELVGQNDLLHTGVDQKTVKDLEVFERHRRRFGRTLAGFIKTHDQSVAGIVGLDSGVIEAMGEVNRIQKEHASSTEDTIIVGGGRYLLYPCNPDLIDPTIRRYLTPDGYLRNLKFEYLDQNWNKLFAYQYRVTTQSAYLGLEIQTKTPKGMLNIHPKLTLEGQPTEGCEINSYGPKNPDTGLNPTKTTLRTFYGNTIYPDEPMEDVALQRTEYSGDLMVHVPYEDIDELGNVSLRDGTPIYVNIRPPYKGIKHARVFRYDAGKNAAYRHRTTDHHHKHQGVFHFSTTDTDFTITTKYGDSVTLPLRDNLYDRVEAISGIF